MLKNSTKHNEIETNLAVLIDLIPNPVVVINGAGRIFEANSLVRKLSGYTREEVVGKSIADIDFIYPESRNLIANSLKAKLGGNEVPPYEIKMTTKSGDIKFLKVSEKQFNCHRENFDLFIFYVVSEENKIQALMRQDLFESEEKFRNITNSVKEAIVVVDDRARVTYWNPAAEKTFGYTSQEAMGKGIHELVVPDSICPEAKQRIEISVKTFTQTGMGYYTVGNVEVVGRRKDGSEFPVELSLSPIKLNGKWSAVGVIKNITQRRISDQKLRDAERRYHALFNQAPLGVLIIDPETGSFVEFNDLAPMQLGYSREEFEKLTAYDIEIQHSPETFREYTKKTLTEGKGEFETKHRSKDGEVRNVWIIARTFPSGNKTFLHCVFSDITEIKKAQNKLSEYSHGLEKLVKERTEQLKQAQAELLKSERLAAIGELAGMIGHDLRNPLSGIKNSAYFMKKKGSAIMPDQAKEMLETIDKCVGYSNKIVNDLLDYSKDVQIVLQEESPRELLLESVNILDFPKGIELVNHLKDKPTLLVDREQIKRVFINLLKNAIDAMSNCGKIKVESRHANGYLEIAFSDTGKGISDEILPKLFSPLFTTKAQGMGFGLAICKRIIEAHGGNINVKTVKDQGTTFTVTLPIVNKNKNGGENLWINTQESSLLMTMKQSEQQ